MSYRRYIYNKDELIFMNNLNSTDSVLSNNSYLGSDPYLRTLVIPDCIKKGSHIYASKSTIKPNLHQSKSEHRVGHHYHHASHSNSGGGSGDGPHHGPGGNSYVPNSGLAYNGRSDKYFGHSHHHYNHHPKQHNPGTWFYAEHQHQAPPYARQSSHHEDSGNVYVNFGSKERAVGGADYGSGTQQPRRRIYSESSQRDPSAGRDQTAKLYPYHNTNSHGIYKTGTPKAPQYQQGQGYRPVEFNNPSPLHSSFSNNDKVQYNASKNTNEGGLDFGLGPIPPSFISSPRPAYHLQGQAVNLGQTTMSSALGAEQKRTASPSNLARRRNLTYNSGGDEGVVAKSGAIGAQEMLKPPAYHHSGTPGVGSSLNKVSATDLSSITNSPLHTHYYTPLTSPRWDSLHQTPHNFTHHNMPQSLAATKELETFSTGTTTTENDPQLGSYFEATSSINRTPKGYRLNATPTANSNRAASPALLKSEVLFLYLNGHLRPWDTLCFLECDGSAGEITVQDLLHPHHGNLQANRSDTLESLRTFREQLASLLAEISVLVGVDRHASAPPCSPNAGVVLGDVSTLDDVAKVALSASESEQKESGSKKKSKNKKNKGSESSPGKAAQLPTPTKPSDVEPKTKLTPVEPLTVPEVNTESFASIAVMDGDKGSQKPRKKKKPNKKGQIACPVQTAAGTSKETDLSQHNLKQYSAAVTESLPPASPIQETSQGQSLESETPVLAHPKYETVKQKSQDILSSLLTISPRVPSDFDGQDNNASNPKSNQTSSLAGKGIVPNEDKVKGSEPQPQIKSANTGEWQKIESRGKKSKKSTSNTGTK